MTIKKIIGIVSCKGGVGKSTLAVNLAVLLSFLNGKRVGLLDADIHGPNHPRMLGLSDTQLMTFSKNKLLPKKCFKLLSMSIGYFLKADSSVLLRGPMIGNTVNYLFRNTEWENLDILIIDFPPGTGDIYLSILRDIKIDDVFLVTTPQLTAVEDLMRSVSMLKKFNINILGLLENMKFYKCNSCNYSNYIYVNNNIKTLVNKLGLSKSYELPLHSFISKSSNIGVPFVLDKFCLQYTRVIKDMSLLL